MAAHPSHQPLPMPSKSANPIKHTLCLSLCHSLLLWRHTVGVAGHSCCSVTCRSCQHHFPTRVELNPAISSSTSYSSLHKLACPLAAELSHLGCNHGTAVALQASDATTATGSRHTRFSQQYTSMLLPIWSHWLHHTLTAAQLCWPAVPETPMKTHVHTHACLPPGCPIQQLCCVCAYNCLL